MQCDKKAGFTLLELSIVIVIIGLIVAGISAGQSLVKQAQLRQVTSQLNAITTGINSFKLQFDALPGDIENAYDYWGTAFGCTDALATPSSTGCNGDGDGTIEQSSVNSRQESYRAWQQLSYLSIIDGSYTGNYSAGFNCQPGTNTPEFYDIGGADFADSTRIQVGAPVTTNNCYAALFTPAETQGLDVKMDDGVAGTGILLGINGSGGPNCLNSGAYDLTQTTRQCIFQYETQ